MLTKLIFCINLPIYDFRFMWNSVFDGSKKLKISPPAEAVRGQKKKRSAASD